MKRIPLVAVLVLLVASVASAQCLLTFQTEAFPAFVVGEPVNFQIVAVSGTEPYHFEIVEGTLPEGLHLNAHGRITGKVKGPSEGPVFVRVTDAAGCQVTQAFDVQVFLPGEI